MISSARLRQTAFSLQEWWPEGLPVLDWDAKKLQQSLELHRHLCETTAIAWMLNTDQRQIVYSLVTFAQNK